MARYKAELPNGLIKDIEKRSKVMDKMVSEMLEAGASVVFQNIKANVPKSWHSSDILNCLHITDVYKTPSDGAWNIKVAMYGYFYAKDGRKTPSELVANVTEYGRSTSDYPKHPFMRKSFNKKKITDAMMDVQRKYMRE